MRGTLRDGDGDYFDSRRGDNPRLGQPAFQPLKQRNVANFLCNLAISAGNAPARTHRLSGSAYAAGLASDLHTLEILIFEGMTMAEVLVQFDSEIVDPDQHAYVARVCGREAEDGLWDGWIEFEPTGGGPVLRTPRETKQPKRTD